MDVTVVVDGKNEQMKEGENLLLALRNKKYDLPGLCYCEKLSTTGSCRLCIIKKKDSNKFETACTLLVNDKLDIEVFTPELTELRKEILQLILSEHKHDCMVCESSGDCELEQLAYRYQISVEKEIYLQMYNKELTKNVSEVLIYDPQKCIKCYRCIKACEELQGKHILDIANRGCETIIWPGLTGIWSDSDCDGCGECIQICPVGALTEKNIIGKGRIWEFKKAITTCEYCGVGCSLEIYIKNNEIVKVKGFNGPANKGRLCIKGRFGHEYISNKDRLTTPLIKKNGKFIESSWDEAIEYIAKNFLKIKTKHGSQSLAGLASAKCTNEENYLFQKFVRIVFGNNNVDHCARLCHASTVVGLGKAFGSGAMTNSIIEFKDTQCIFIIGSNTTETHPVIATFIKNAVSNGTILIVADPRKIDLVKYAKIHLQQQHGTDVALINGIMNIIYNEGLMDEKFVKNRTEGFNEFIKVIKQYSPKKVEEITGISQDKLIYAARLYGQAKSASIIFSMGITQHITGTDNVLSIANLAMLTGNVGKPYSGVNPLRGQNNVQGACDVGALPNVYPGYQVVISPEIQEKFQKAWNMKLSNNVGLTVIEIMNAAAEGKIKGLYIMGENPMISDPNISHVEKALKNLNFLVVQDIFLTETAKLADVVLPSRGTLEKDGTFTNTERRIQRVKKIIEPSEGTKNDWEIIGLIGEKMGFKNIKFNNVWDILRELNKLSPLYNGITPERIDENLQWPCPSIDHPGTKYLHKDKFTRGKGLFTPVDFVPPAELPDEKYPLILSTGRILFHYHTGTMSRRNEVLNAFVNEGYVEISSEDAYKLKIKDLEKVKVSTRRGSIKIKVKITNKVFPGSVFIPFHFWEAPANKLTNDVLDPKAKIPELKVAACKIEKI